MSVSLYSVKLARTVLLWQLATLLVIGVLCFALKDISWGASAIAGGLAAAAKRVVRDFGPAHGRASTC